MTSNDEKLNRGFRALANQGARQAPPSVELALLRTFRKRKARRTLTWCVASLAAVLLVVIFVPRPKPLAPPQPRLARIAVPEIVVARKRPDDRPGGLSHFVRHRRAPQQTPGEIATRFYPLQDTATMPPFEYGTLVRVQLPRSALRVVGLPVNEDRVSESISADVLLGQDGLARAVRFVQ